MTSCRRCAMMQLMWTRRGFVAVIQLVLLAVVSMSCQSSPMARASGPSDDAAWKKLAEDYVAALRAKDTVHIHALDHPKVRACINDSTREYFDSVADREAAEVPQTAPRVSIAPLKENSIFFSLPKDQFTYPVSPTHQLEMDWTREDNSGYSIELALAKEGHAWYVVYPCPNAEGVRAYHERMVEQREAEERARKLAAAIKDPLRKELKDLLKQGHKIDAIKKYQAVGGLDLTTAVQVMNVLEATED